MFSSMLVLTSDNSHAHPTALPYAFATLDCIYILTSGGSLFILLY